MESRWVGMRRDLRPDRIEADLITVKRKIRLKSATEGWDLCPCSSRIQKTAASPKEDGGVLRP
jgi:hypothetical protein